MSRTIVHAHHDHRTYPWKQEFARLVARKDYRHGADYDPAPLPDEPEPLDPTEHDLIGMLYADEDYRPLRRETARRASKIRTAPRFVNLAHAMEA